MAQGLIQMLSASVKVPYIAVAHCKRVGVLGVVLLSRVFHPFQSRYCSQVKGLFKQLGVPAKVIELDEISECSQAS